MHATLDKRYTIISNVQHKLTERYEQINLQMHNMKQLSVAPHWQRINVTLYRAYWIKYVLLYTAICTNK